MIKVKRSPQPHILQQRGSLWKEKLLKAKKTHRLTPNKTAKQAVERAEGKYRHWRVKTALVTMFFGKCGYCESKITHVDYGHIEHYRPKSRYPARAFEWSNLLLACGMCNGPEHKGDRFPKASENGPPINPCDEEPSDHLEFHFDSAASLASVYGKSLRGETTVMLLGLNRLDLRAFRSAEIRKLIALARFAETDDEAKHLLDKAIEDGAQFAAFARMIAHKIP